MTTIQIMRNLFVPVILALCLGACAPGHNDYSDFAYIPHEGWAYNDSVLLFVKSDADTVIDGKLKIAIRHNNSYHYSNLWLEVSNAGNDGITMRDTLEIKLADIYGHWYGKGIGANYQLETVLPENYRLHTKHPVAIRHIMRVDTLCGIEQLGILFHANTTNR